MTSRYSFPSMIPPTSQSKSFSCDCPRYCKGRLKNVSRSTYNRHKKYRELVNPLDNNHPFITDTTSSSNLPNYQQQQPSVEFLNAQGSYNNFGNDENEHRRKRKKVESENGEALKLDDSDELARRHFTNDVLEKFICSLQHFLLFFLPQAPPMSNSLSGNISPLSNALGLYLYTPDTSIFANYSDRTNFENTAPFSTTTPSTPITARSNSSYNNTCRVPLNIQPALSRFSSLPSMFASNGSSSAYLHYQHRHQYHDESLLHPLERVDIAGRKTSEQIPMVSTLVSGACLD
jgi:hypothetical protein